MNGKEMDKLPSCYCHGQKTPKQGDGSNSDSVDSYESTDNRDASHDKHQDQSLHPCHRDWQQRSFESCPTKREDSFPVQCTEDCHERDTEVCLSKDETEVPQQSQVNACVQDDIDLPHKTSETSLSTENESVYKRLRLKVNENLDLLHSRPPEIWADDKELADEEKLRLKNTPDERTRRKQLKSNGMENVDLSPLDVSPFLKFQFRNQVVVYAYMLRAPLPASTPSSRKPDQNDLCSNSHLSELSRLATYSGYPTDIRIFAITLARDGFIFLPNEQSIECSFCKLRIHLSELRRPDADPVVTHGNRCPQCPLKQRESSGNMPVPEKESSRELKSRRELNSLSHGTSDAISDAEPDSVSSMTNGFSHEKWPAPVQYQTDGATVMSSPVVHCPPKDLAVDSVAVASQDNTSRIPEGNVQPSELSQPNQPHDTSSPGMNGNAATLERSDGAAAQVTTSMPSNGDSNHRNGRNSSSPGSRHQQSGSEQTGASASASSAANNPTRNAKPAKKSRAARRAEARRANSTTSASTPPAPPQTSGKKEDQSKDKKKLTYGDLGIFAEKPKRPDMAALQKRLTTYEGKWQPTYAKTPQTLAECGMYYAGYSDCARCFFCGGGLKNWESGDEPWIEHARWFPKCAYLLLCKGQVFVDIVQKKNDKNEKIIMKDVEEEVRQKNRALEASTVSLPPTSSDGKNRGGAPQAENRSSNVQDIRKLEKENEELLGDLACKICMDEKSSVVFLPCGHMVACTDCAVVLKSCPLCRADIRGTVKAIMDF